MTTALYRRYRPETFQDVIGQSHVTDPLMTALRKNKVNHAYLFSGPRGCGKTTSARILARCLNCAEGPTPNPCGQCQSCLDLSREGAGSLDVIEMDAASHGGVDDARQLRERATFAPVRDRYKIFIIDEAHMVTRDGFNALLKIVEEPPEHIKFIFATTEPNKVLPTIRSRTHHYPFRLVPPEPLMDYLQQLCDQETVGVEPGVLAMVVRAGGGSVRDSLSVLDQLMAGTDGSSVSYDLAVSLLGYTHGALLDDVVDAFASGDAATVFRAVDRVIQTGQDPRRFVEDLLERFRDLVIVDAVPDSAANILHGMPEDQVARLRNQAQLMGAAELSRAADITNEALTEMTGATSPQLHLELLCARLLLPSAENSARGAGARIDRLERRLNMGRTGAPTGPLVAVSSGDQAQKHHDDASRALQSESSASVTHTPRVEAAQSSPLPPPAQPPARTAASTDADRHELPEQSSRQSTNTDAGAQAGATEAQPERSEPRRVAVQESPRPRADATSAQGPASGGGIDMIRGSWTEIVNTLADIHRVSWMTVMRATPAAFDGSVLQVIFEGAGDRKNFPRFEPNLVAAIQQVLGVSCRVEAIGPGDGGARPSETGEPQSPPSTPKTGTGGGPGSGADPGAWPRSRSAASDPRSDPRFDPQDNARAQPRSPRSNGPSQSPPGITARPMNTAPDQSEPLGDANGHGPSSPAPSAGSSSSAEVTSSADSESASVDSWTVAQIPTAAPASAETPTIPTAPVQAPQDTDPVAPDDAPSTGPVTPRPDSGREPAQPDTAAPSDPHAPSYPDDPYDGVPWPDDPPPEEEPPPAEAREQVNQARNHPRDRESIPPEQWRPTQARDQPHGRQGSGPPAGTSAPSPEASAASSQTATSTTNSGSTRAAPARRPSFRERHAAQIAAGSVTRTSAGSGAPRQETTTEEDFVPSDDDLAVESSGLQGRAMIEKILGGRLVEERPHQPLL